MAFCLFVVLISVLYFYYVSYSYAFGEGRDL